jgi:hypothetical protein
MNSFTGSTEVGRRLADSPLPKPVHLELGGNAAAIILDDADLDLAVEKIRAGSRSSMPVSAAMRSAAFSSRRAPTIVTWRELLRR